jgi:hypothetical protein
MRRSRIMLALAASAALTTAAQAQTGPGTIYYQYGSPAVTYKVAGNGTQNVTVGNVPTPGGRGSALSIYPGGRQFAHAVMVGTIPGTSLDYADLTLYSETGIVPTTVTRFRGPQYVEQTAPRYQLSNDHQDSFFSFLVYDPRTGNRILYRYNGPLADVFVPGFVPFSSDDPQLTPITTFPENYVIGNWDNSGTKVFYQVSVVWPSDVLLYVFDTTTGTKTLVNNPAVSGVNMLLGCCSSTEFRMFGPATTNSGVKGIVSFYPATGQFNWVIQEGGRNSNKISAFSPTAISPDGTVLAFGLLRVVNGQTRPTLARIPVSGGTYTPLVTFPANSTNTVNPGSQGWTW